jgi:hypothetical protein
MVEVTSMRVVHRNTVGKSRDLRAGWMAWGAALLLAAVATACNPAERQGAAASVTQASAAVDGDSVDGSSVEGSSVDARAEAGAAAADGGANQASAAKGAGNPLGELVPPAPGQEPLVGVVAEHLPAGGYTYLWVEPEEGPARWVVTMRRDVGQGDRVRVDSLGSRQDFYSRRLDRRFAELVFGVVEVVG